MILARLIALPGWLKAALAGIAAALLIGLGVSLWLDARDKRVIRDVDRERALEASVAREDAANQRAIDVVVQAATEKQREAVIAEAAAEEARKPIDQRAKLPPTTVALNCQRLREAYTAVELARMGAFREVCK